MAATCQGDLACAVLDANLSVPDHGAAQMGAKDHPALPVHRNAEGMFDLVRRGLRREKAVASAVRDADLDAAVRRNFREQSPAPVHDCHPSASAGVKAELVVLRANLGMPPLVVDQSAGQARGVQAVAVAKVVGHRDQVLRAEGRQIGANLAAEEARQVAALDEGPPPQVPLEVSVQQVLPQATLRERQAAGPLTPELPLEAEPQGRPPRVLQESGLELPVPRPGQQALVAAELPAWAQSLPAAVPSELPLEPRPVEQQRPALVRWRRVQRAAFEPLGPLRPSHPFPPELSLQLRLLRPRRPEGACEPSRLHPSESSWSASSFLLRRTRATGR
jgi:hypothetical protein